MAWKRPITWEPGETLIACTLCGFPRKFPSELWYGPDGKYYCDRHEEWRLRKTVLDDSRERAAWRPPVEEVPQLIGPKPSWR